MTENDLVTDGKNMSLNESPAHKVIESYLRALKYRENIEELGDVTESLRREVIADPHALSQLLKNIIRGLKTRDIELSRARIVAAEACKILGDCVLNYPYKKGEEEKIKKIIKLLEVLVVGAIKTRIYTPESQTSPSSEVEQNSSLDYIDSSYDEESETNSEEADSINLELLKQKDPYRYRDFYGFNSLIIISSLFYETRISTSEKLLEIAVFYSSEWSDMTTKSLQRFEKLICSFITNESSISTDEYLQIMEGLGFREVLGLAEFQYRKNRYVGSKSKLQNQSYEMDSDYSPLEIIEEQLFNFLKKLKDSLLSGISSKASNVTFGSEKTYFTLETGHSPEEQVMIIFNALTKMYLDGLQRNCQAREQIEQGLQFSKRSQESFSEINQFWWDKLNQLTRFTIGTKMITTPNGHRFKKIILDWPLSSFFMQYDGQKGKITQIINTDKINQLNAEECASLLTLLYCSIHETQNPLGQVQGIYAAIRDRLEFNKTFKQYIEDYLAQRGFTQLQIAQILHSKEIIEKA